LQQAPYRPRNDGSTQPDEGEQANEPPHDVVNRSLPIVIPVAPSSYRRRSRSVPLKADTDVMKHRRAMRDRLAWIVALAAIAVVLYIVVPLWVLVVAVAVAIAVPLFLRRNRARSNR
jgi:Flp pilus assembly protein TadB